MNNILKLSVLYVLMVLLVVFQVPVLIPAMVDLKMQINLGFIVLFWIKKYYPEKAYIIGLVIFMFTLIATSNYLLDPIADFVGIIVFNRIYKHKHSIRTIFGCVIIIVFVNFFAIPYPFIEFEMISSNYLQILTSTEYIRYYLAIYPAFYFLQWSIIVFVIDKIVNRNVENN